MEIWQRNGAEGARPLVPASRSRAIHARSSAVRGDWKAARRRGNFIYTPGTDASRRKTKARIRRQSAYRPGNFICERGKHSHLAWKPAHVRKKPAYIRWTAVCIGPKPAPARRNSICTRPKPIYRCWNRVYARWNPIYIRWKPSATGTYADFSLHTPPTTTNHHTHHERPPTPQIR